MRLKNYGIYALPDRREFVVRAGPTKAYLLHDLRLGPAHPPIYLIDESGQVLSWGRPTKWRIDDLKDTGRVSPGLELEGLRLL